jgi:hypothetical protein
LWSGPRLVVRHPGGRFIGAGSPLPFPLRFGLVPPLPNCHGAGVHARGPTYVGGEATRSVGESPTAGLLALDNFRDSAVVQAGLFGDCAQRKAGGLGVGKCLPPCVPHGLGVSLKPGLGVADGVARLLRRVSGHQADPSRAIPATDRHGAHRQPAAPSPDGRVGPCRH